MTKLFKTKSSDKEHYISRRQFLNMSGLTAIAGIANGPIEMFFKAFTDTLINNAQASTAGLGSRNYLAVLFGGAPPRWMWDSFLCPSGNLEKDFIKNGSLNNYITSGNYSKTNSDAEYRVEPVTNLYSDPSKVLYLSPLWNRNIPTADGNQVLMKELLRSAVIVRGVNMGPDIGHSLGTARLVRPEPSNPSLSGVVGDLHTDSFIKTVGLAGWNSYSFLEGKYMGHYAKSGLGIVTQKDNLGRTKTDNPMLSMLNPFNNNDPRVKSQSAKSLAMKPHIDAALGEMKKFSELNYPGSDFLYKSAGSIEQLALKNLQSISEEFVTVYSKYATLLTRSAGPIANIIPANSYGAYNGTSGRFDYTPFATQFAMAELLFRHGICKNVTISVPESSINVNYADNERFYTPFDEHSEFDRQKSVIVFSVLWRSLAACIYEFKSQIGATEWKNTVVQVGAEYDRAPDNGGFGTDHAPDSNVYTFFSGMVNEPILIGNILKNAREREQYKGSWGASAPTMINGTEQTITPQMGVATAATLLGVPSPVRAVSLVVDNNGSFASVAEAPKNVG